MWRLKIAGGGKDPYLSSTNNFVGRQTWEFDPNYGSEEERLEVEKARLHYWNHRHQVKPSSDVLWRMQFMREKKFKQDIAQVKIEDGEEVSYDKVTTTLRRSVHLFAALQAEDGHWPAENAGPMYFMPPLNKDGGWGFHIGGHSTMFGTTLNYICMRLLGEGLDGGLDGACGKARKWILDHGSATVIPSWGKTWLSSFGSQAWDASFAIQALLATDISHEICPTLKNVHEFIKASQVKDNPSGDFESMYRHTSKGSWTFSDQDHGLQVSDSTSEGLKLYYAAYNVEQKWWGCSMGTGKSITMVGGN
ncbi:hypothetical protein SSX86_004348 [Deinandra increscens subsp. villosa]|uniref:Squalene cyclase N-terminal domain-containing protein n=1 Tax=Deinandra increscens subsp. villosa TaxID=3103831 RepID=A0AAP0H5U7_9ASTR